MESMDLPVHGFGVRHVQVALIFFMVIAMYAISMAPPIGIVAITTPGTSPNPSVPTYPEWTDQSLILTSFYWGYAPFQLIGGPLCRKYGFKWFMIVSMLVASLISIWIPPLIIEFGSYALMICFFIQGLCHGLVMPMFADFISKWAPVSERTTIGTFIFASKTLGTVFATEITGLLSSSWWGWPSTFYLYGGIGVTWCAFMIALGSNSPNEHKTISQAEVEYINRGKHLTKKRVPWSKIWTSVPLWATWITNIGIVWTIRLSTTEFPTYINRVLGLNVGTASAFLSITYLLAYANTFLVSNVSQYMINRNYLSTGACRKICNSIACWGSAFLLTILAVFSMGSTLQMIVIFLLFICSNASFSGYQINYNDLSPNYSGCIFGVGGIAATIISFAPTTLVQYMVTNQMDASQWSHPFLLAAGITSLGNVLFVLKGSGEVQDWDNLESEQDDEESRVLLEKSQN